MKKRANLPQSIRLNAYKSDLEILKPNDELSKWVNRSQSCSVGLPIKEDAVFVDRSGSQGSDYHAIFIDFPLSPRITKRAMSL